MVNPLCWSMVNFNPSLKIHLQSKIHHSLVNGKYLRVNGQFKFGMKIHLRSRIHLQSKIHH